MSEIQAVVFDLYETLVYSRIRTNPYRRLFIDLGFQPQSIEYLQARGIAFTESFGSLADFVQRIKPDFSLSLESYEKDIDDAKKSVVLYPETVDVLTILKERGFRLGLISNLAFPYKEPFFRLGLAEYFHEVIFSCDVDLSKPDKRIYENILMGFYIERSRILMTGDTLEADVLGPQRVGMRAVHLDRSGTTLKSISTLHGIFDYL